MTGKTMYEFSDRHGRLRAIVVNTPAEFDIELFRLRRDAFGAEYWNPIDTSLFGWRSAMISLMECPGEIVRTEL